MDGDQPAGAPRRTIPWALVVPAALLAAWLLVPLALRLWAAPSGWNLFSDRDLVRASRLWLDRPTSGAEFSGGRGGRIPGGLQYVPMALALAVKDDPVVVQRLVYVLDTLGLGVLGWGAWRAAGRGPAGALAAALAVAVGLGTSVTNDAIGQVWNPAWMPLFLAVAAVAVQRLAAGGDRRWLVLAALAVACGAQMHMMVLGWAVAAALALAVARPPGVRRATPAAAVAFVVPYLPWLIAEARHGFPSARRVAAEPYVRMLGTKAPRVERWRDVDVVPTWLAGHAPAAALPDALTALRWTAVVGFAVGLGLAARRRQGEARGVLVLAGTVVLTTLGLLLESPSMEERYVAVVAPAFAIVAAWGLAAPAAALARRSAVAGGLVATLLAAAVALPTTWWLDRRGGTIVVLERTLASLQNEAGLDAVGVAGKALFVQDVDGKPDLRPLFAFDDVLRRAGGAWPGSDVPPCVAVADRPIDDALLAAVLHDTGATPHVTRAWQAAPAWIALYDPGLPRCPVSAVNRYVDTDAEASLRPLLKGSPDRVVATPIPGGTRYGVAVATAWHGRKDRLVVGVDLVLDGADLVATLHGNQLRGEPANVVWGPDEVVDRPRLRLGAADGTSTELVLVDGRVGGRGAATPLSARVPRPAGATRVTLLLDVVRRKGPKAVGPLGSLEAHEIELTSSL